MSLILKLNRKKCARRSQPQTQPVQSQPQPVQSQPQPVQPPLPHQSRPQPQSTQPQPRSRPRTRLQSKPAQPQPPSQPQPQPQPIQPQLPHQSQLQRRPTRPRSRSQPQSKPAQPQPQPLPLPPPQATHSQPPPPPPPQSQPQPQSTRSHIIPTHVVDVQEYSEVNAALSSSSSHEIGGGNEGNKIPILPEGDGFDKHRMVISEIASIIRSNLKEGKPSWKQLSSHLRDEWFLLFDRKFTWPSEYEDKVRRNFEKRGSGKMIQLMQEARKDLDHKPTWMEEAVWVQLKAHWESSTFKKKSEINRRNHNSMDGASLHTGGSIPHRLHWKRMKEEKGTDPSLVDFYFRTHRRKDQSWVGVHAEAAYEKFEQKKIELSSTFAPGEDVANSQPSDLDIWVQSVGKKKGRIFGLGSVTQALIPSSKKPKLSSNSEEVDALRKQIYALNESLQRQEQEMQRQEQEKLHMKQNLTESRKQLVALMEHFGLAASSSRSSSLPQHENEEDACDELSNHID